MSNKPRVFPPSEGENQKPTNTIQNNNPSTDKIQEIYTSSAGGEQAAAIEAMRKRTEEQLRQREEKKEVKIIQEEPKPVPTNVYGSQKTINIPPPNKPPINSIPRYYGDVPKKIDTAIDVISQPDFNTAFDVIPLPSEGKCYKSKKKNVRVSYLTAADEDILTSPNLLASGEFIEILINRKLLDTELRYADLLLGDRNAIMIWLRATSFGSDYKVELLDENDIPFETNIDISQFPIVNLAISPDEEGLFSVSLPSGSIVKIKLLTIGEIEHIEALVKQDKENGEVINRSNTYTLEHQIVEINENRDRMFICDEIRKMRISDTQELNKFISQLECGVDLRLKVGTPGGGSIESFLPLNTNFFWPGSRS